MFNKNTLFVDKLAQQHSLQETRLRLLLERTEQYSLGSVGRFSYEGLEFSYVHDVVEWNPALVCHAPSSTAVSAKSMQFVLETSTRRLGIEQPWLTLTLKDIRGLAMTEAMDALTKSADFNGSKNRLPLQTNEMCLQHLQLLKLLWSRARYSLVYGLFNDLSYSRYELKTRVSIGLEKKHSRSSFAKTSCFKIGETVVRLRWKKMLIARTNKSLYRTLLSC